jgi:hypothetical protein
MYFKYCFQIMSLYGTALPKNTGEKIEGIE